MNKLTPLPETTFAGHCTVGGSNKVWLACLAREQEPVGTPCSALNASTQVLYLCVYGAYGARLRVEPPQRLPYQQARALLQKKWREKTGKGYQSIAFAPYVSSFVYPNEELILVAPDESTALGIERAMPEALLSRSAIPPIFRHTASTVKALTWEDLQAKLGDPAYGWSEKVNGERCLLEFDGTTLLAYNRKGQRVPVPPQGALPLMQMSVPWVLDGERIPGECHERFIAFDLLEWHGASLRTHPYRQRILKLLLEMKQAHLLKEILWAPTSRQALANSLASDLAVLAPVNTPEEQYHLLEDVLAAGGEGIIIRPLAASYDVPPWKHKFQADLDAFVYAVEPGLAGGSLKLGLLRCTDQQVIAIGQVRAGLTASDMQTIQSLLNQGQFPVLTVHYLPARTTGIHLVEPHTSIRLLRTDKTASECTTEQFGKEKADLIAQAKPVSVVLMR